MGRTLRWVALGVAVLVILGAGAAAGAQLKRPVPRPTLHREIASSLRVPGSAPALPLPATGQAALYLPGFGWLGSSSAETAVPIASVTKIVTALVVLRAHPLSSGSVGPAVTVAPSDVALYQSEIAQGDSVVAVQAGESLTELQLLEGLLLPSGDNLAVLLADWVAGSEPAFVARMNQLVSTLHLRDTHFTDSSGLDPASVSSARDLVTLAVLAMKNPVFASVVAMPEVTLPVAGTLHNYNPILGQAGVVGIKTGWTAAALGCLVFAANTEVAGRPVQLIGAVLGQPGGPESGLVAAARVASALLSAGESGLRLVRLPTPGTLVARLTAPWSKSIAVRAGATLSLVAQAGAGLAWSIRSEIPRLPLRRRSEVGYLTLTTPVGIWRRVPLLAARGLTGPSLWWRLTRHP
ncbi:MAG: D-alanyl-D-alanine carboxypeptidase [Candidatus Dormiibacterota bacterium]